MQSLDCVRLHNEQAIWLALDGECKAETVELGAVWQVGGRIFRACVGLEKSSRGRVANTFEEGRWAGIGIAEQRFQIVGTGSVFITVEWVRGIGMPCGDDKRDEQRRKVTDVAGGGGGADKTGRESRIGVNGADNTLRAVAGTLDEPLAAEVALDIVGGRIAEVETCNRPTTDFSHEQRTGELFAQGKGLVDFADQQNFRSARAKGITGTGEGAQHVNHDYGAFGVCAVIQG